MNVTVGNRTRHYRTVSFDKGKNAVVLIEQRLLPHQFALEKTRDFRHTAKAIQDMVVRGAPAIAATAAYGLAQGARTFGGTDPGKFARHIEAVFQILKVARPTAVDPLNAMNFVRAAMRAGETVEEQQRLAFAAAEEFANRSVEECRAIGKHGAKLIRECAEIHKRMEAGERHRLEDVIEELGIDVNRKEPKPAKRTGRTDKGALSKKTA